MANLDYEALWDLAGREALNLAAMAGQGERWQTAMQMRAFLERIIPVHGDWLRAAYELGQCESESEKQ